MPKQETFNPAPRSGFWSGREWERNSSDKERAERLLYLYRKHGNAKGRRLCKRTLLCSSIRLGAPGKEWRESHTVKLLHEPSTNTGRFRRRNKGGGRKQVFVA